MAYNSLSVSSPRPQLVWRVYTGDLISSLIAIAERTANKIHSNDGAGREIVSDAQDLKAQRRAWYELQAALAASASGRSR